MNPLSLLNLSEKFLINVLFPKTCLGCGKEDTFVCDLCKKSLEQLSFQNCPVCEKAITISGEQCRRCAEIKDIPVRQFIVAGDYDNKLLTKTIHTYKYKFVEDLSSDLGMFLTEALRKWISVTPDIIIPVPLHRKRLRWRGFNQSLLLAKYISQNLLPGIEISIEEDLLIRERHTQPQMQIKKHFDRQQNIQGAFKVKNLNRSLRNKNVLLIDDVCTTGATVFECAKEISKLHPRTITATTLARQNVR